MSLFSLIPVKSQRHKHRLPDGAHWFVHSHIITSLSSHQMSPQPRGLTLQTENKTETPCFTLQGGSEEAAPFKSNKNTGYASEFHMWTQCKQHSSRVLVLDRVNSNTQSIQQI